MKNKNLICAFIITFFMLSLSSCTNDEPGIVSPSATDIPDITENGLNPDETGIIDATDHHHRTAYIYTQSNAAGQNNILSYKQQSNGSLTQEATVPSGGNGTGTGLGNSGALSIHRNGNWLFAVNAGSNSVSTFAVAHNGSLTISHSIPTGGIRPVSVTSHNNLLYVVNAGSDNISGFSMNPAGILTAIAGSTRSLSSAGSAPAQISFSPNGHYLYVTEKMTNKITTFPIDHNGAAGAGTSISSTGQTPFGFDFSGDRYLIISNASGGAPIASTSTSYRGINSGNLSPVNGSVPNNQSAACWVATTNFGRFAFVTNTGSDNISTYYVGFSGRLYLIHAIAETTEDAPTDICVSPNNLYVYTLNSMSHSIGGYRRTLLGDLNILGTTQGLPEYATGLVVK